MTEDSPLNEREMEFWFTEIFPMIFDSDPDIQENAIAAMDKVIPLLLVSQHQLHPYWECFRSDILKDYTHKVNELFVQANAKWHFTWCQCVRILDIDIPRSATTLNAFLSIVEQALRSSTAIRRAEGYLCWRVSILTNVQPKKKTIIIWPPKTNEVVFNRCCWKCWCDTIA